MGAFSDRAHGETVVMTDRASQPPRRDWPQIGDIIPNHDGYRPPPTAELVGQSYSFTLSDGTTLDLRFESATRPRFYPRMSYSIDTWV